MSPFLAWGDFHARSRFAPSTIPKEKWGTTRVSPFLVWGDFHARSLFAGSTIPEEKWGTTRTLIVSRIGLCVSCLGNIERFESSIFLIIRMITDPFELLLV